MRTLSIVVSFLFSICILVQCDESSQSTMTHVYASDLRRRYRRKLQNGGAAGGDAGGKDAGGGDAGGKDAGGGDAGGEANGPDGGHDNGPDNGHDNHNNQPDNKDDHGCHAPDYHGCAPPTPMPSPYQAHPSYRYPTPLPTPSVTSLSAEDASAKEGLFSSGDYAEDAEIGLAVGAALAVCAILACVAYVFYKAKMHVAVARRWRESIAQRGGDGTSTIEIALAMLEGEDTSLFTQSFDESSGGSQRVSTDQYGTAIDVSMRDSSRGTSSAQYGPASGAPRGRPLSNRGQHGPAGVVNMDTNSGRVHVHDTNSYAATPHAPLPGHAGRGMAPGHAPPGTMGGMGGSRHGYDSADGRPPPRYGTGGRKTKAPSSGGTAGYGRLAPDV